jgi:hypothetical protein
MHRLRRLSDYFYAKARPARTALLLLTFAGFFWAFNLSSWPISVPSLRALASGQTILDLRPWYAFTDAYALMFSLGEAGRSLYRSFLGLDFVFLCAYGAGFSFLMSLLLKSASWNRGRLRYANVLPLGIALADALENLATLAQLLAYPRPLPVIANLGGAFTLSKHAGTMLAIAIIILAASAAVKQRNAQ